MTDFKELAHVIMEAGRADKLETRGKASAVVQV